jgi:YebC/PmpR family DNA-binding regulatory protein
MARHSKWSKVKTFKGAIDAKRGKMFSKLAREVMVAARLGGGDPETNARLRMVLLRCRAASMPGENVERAIKKGTGDTSGVTFEDLTYEIFAPHGVALLVELTTDNRNRTAAEIRSLVTKAGGNIAGAGSVARLFHRKGQIIVATGAAEEDELMGVALDAGAEDYKVEPEGFEVITDPARFEAVHKAVESRGIVCAAAQVTALPTLTVPVSGAAAEVVSGLIEAIEDHDDVKELWHNAEFAD